MGHKKWVRKPEPESRIAWPRWTGFRRKTVWDWMQLLIVPLVLTVLGLWFTSAQQDVRQQQIEDRQAQMTQNIEEYRAPNEALQAYLDLMKELLLEQDLRDSRPDSSARAIANVQTSLILEQVGARHKRSILRLLTDSHLIDADAPLIETSTLSLQEADAEDMDLSDTNLSRANLEHANLEGTNLEGTNLEGANLLWTNLNRANLTDADLRYAEGVTREQLRQAESLEGATMPNGQKYEDWLESKG